ncbi:MAG: hypothetical protein J0H67_16145 [Rhodospirillales bacterium]|nr:hypothetical protein [Rhodospirillales bacterium]MBN8902607.1 hypothetical protein [Rhodospirillales bacterium]
MREADLQIPPAAHEPRDVTFLFVLLAFSGLVLALLASAGVALWLYPRTASDHRLEQPVRAFPAPRLQADPAGDLARFLKHEHDRLDHVGWVDQAHGIAHIPIADAMRQVARDGIPDWPTK